MITLAIDTSTTRGSVAVLAYGDVVFEEDFISDRSHSATLFTCLVKARSVARHLDRIVVGLGPGSYAGVRIAISAAIGLQMVFKAQLLGLPSVAALEHNWSRYLAIGDARQGLFYSTAVEDGICVTGPELKTERELRKQIELLGGWPVFTTDKLAEFPTAQWVWPSAAVLGRLASRSRSVLQRGDLEPIYLREPHITKPKRLAGMPAQSRSEIQLE
ncbi:MAG: tRNA (adenosine(37)-N6)-threonylcarbamoyltransferase complex dimerization subunit type 1 TsaB [Chthoniobacteraceae bacterium]